MRILYDHQAFLQRFGGVSRYFVELIDAMREEGNFFPFMPNFFSDNQYLSEKRALISHQSFRGKKYFLKFANQLLIRPVLRQGEYDLFHATHYDPYFISLVRKPFVITVHDMIHELFPASFVRDDGTKRNKRVVVEGCAKILAVSENTKKDLCSILGVSDEKVSVVYHATKLQYTGLDSHREKPYLLYVGERDGYKNFAFFLESIVDILKKYDIDLLCAGGSPFSPNEGLLLDRLNSKDRVSHIPFSSQDVLAGLYRHAVAFCFPSLYEGFGIPILEAFACGCPVILSRRSCFPEIAMDAAAYFEPDNKDSISSCLDSMLSDSSLRVQMIEKGLKRGADFSWKRSAEKTLSVYNDVLNG